MAAQRGGADCSKTCMLSRLVRVWKRAFLALLWTDKTLTDLARLVPAAQLPAASPDAWARQVGRAEREHSRRMWPRRVRVTLDSPSSPRRWTDAATRATAPDQREKSWREATRTRSHKDAKRARTGSHWKTRAIVRDVKMTSWLPETTVTSPSKKHVETSP